MRPLMDLVRALRLRGHNVPNFDPNDGGVNAQALFLFETPGPRAVGSGFVSRDNPDPTARNFGKALDMAGFLRSEVVLWNVVPYCVSTVDQNKNVTRTQIRNAITDTQDFVNCLPKLAAVVFCGRSAQHARKFLHFSDEVKLFCTFHTGAQSYNRIQYRDHIHETFKEVRRRMQRPVIGQAAEKDLHS